jgi:hypothetical protein
MATRLLSTQKIVNISSDPATGTSGEVYFNTTSNVLRYHNGTIWTDFFATQVKHLVKNDSGITLNKGTVVYTSGANGTNVLVKPAQAINDAFSSQTIGFLESTLAPNGIGYVVTNGLISGINTDAALSGDPVWLSPTNPGGVVYGFANEPEAPSHIVYLGVVTRSNTNNGEIFVHISNGWELNELHNVLITNPQNDQVLSYSSASSIWINKTPSSSTAGSIQTDTYLSNMWWLGA